MFVAEFENRLLDTNANVNYKSSLLVLSLNLLRLAGTKVESSTKLMWRYLSVNITQMQC